MGGLPAGESQALAIYKPAGTQQKGGRTMSSLLSKRPGGRKVRQAGVLGAAAGSPAQLAHEDASGTAGSSWLTKMPQMLPTAAGCQARCRS